MASLIKTTRKLPEKSLSGQVVVVIGANAGLGYYVTLELARRQAHVILGCRNEEKGEAAVRNIQAAGAKGKLECWHIDLASFSSIRNFAKKFQDSGLPLNILVLNAGLLSPSQKFTEDGFESTWQVNFLGSALLAGLLLPKLRAGARAETSATSPGPGRLIITSSEGHRLVSDAQILFTDPNGDNYIKPGQQKDKENGTPWGLMNTFQQYVKSKLGQAIWFQELARREEKYRQSHAEAGRVIIQLCHPGTVRSDIAKKPGKKSLLENVTYWVANNVAMPLFGITARQGAATDLWAAISDDDDVIGEKASGGYWIDSKRATPKGEVNDQELGQKLWRQTEEKAGFGQDFY